MNYDPRDHGCRCDECPLGAYLRKRGVWAPVPPEGPEDPQLVLIGEEPGPQEVKYGRPMVGGSGQLLERDLNRLGFTRSEVMLDNALLCFPGETLVSAGKVHVGYRRWYEGPLVRITTVRGHQLTGTPNHPALTPMGLIPLNALVQGQHLVCRSEAGPRATGRPDVQDGPARIDQVFRSLAEVSDAHRVVGRRMDFHGDGADSEVDVVGSFGSLWNGVEAQALQQFEELSLEDADVELIHSPSLSGAEAPLGDGFWRVSAASHGMPCPRCGSERLSFDSCGLAHARSHSLPPVSNASAQFHQGASDDSFVDVEVSSEGFHGSPGGVSCEQCLSVFDGIPTPQAPQPQSFCFGTEDDARLLETLAQGVPGEVGFLRQLLDGLAGLVALDQIAHVEIVDYAGHVYNLGTAEGLYVAQGIVVSNCRPPGNDLARFNAEFTAKINVKINEENRGKPRDQRLPRIPPPQVACRPHVLEQANRAAKLGVPVITLGKLAYWAVTGRTSAVEKVRGSFGEYYRINFGPKEGMLAEATVEAKALMGNDPIVKVTATINPAHALRKPAYKDVLFRDLQRAVRWHHGELDWVDPQKGLQTSHPDGAWLQDWLSRGRWWAWDVETTYEGDLQNKLRTVGIYSIDRQESVVIPWVSINGRVGFAPGMTLQAPFVTDRIGPNAGWWDEFEDYHYFETEGRQIQSALWTWFENPDQWKIGHFSNYFDLTVMKRHLGPFQPNSLVDQILLSRIWNSEFKRSLYFVGTMLTDVPSWKAAEDDRKISKDPRTYDELAAYNVVDIAVTGKTGPILLQHAKDQWPVAQLDHDVEAICREMHWTGLYVHEPRRAELEEIVRGKLQKERDVVRQIAGPEFNPESTKQLGKLLYEQWKLPIPLLTKSGRPSTSEDAIRILLTTPGLLNKEQSAMVSALWRGRGWAKELGTYLLNFRTKDKGGKVDLDGILRSDYGAHIPATGRISSSGGLNTQNIVKYLRSVVQPRPGHVFIISDYDQVELRLMSAAAQVKLYLDEFAKPGKPDPHAVTALLVYGDKFKAEMEHKKRTGEKSKLFSALRTFAKTFVYAVLYGGGVETVYDNVSKATDPETGDLLFPNMGFMQVRACVESWKRNTPEVPRWWEETLRFAEIHGYVEEPILGRRRHMPELMRNEALNHPIQCVSGETRVLTQSGYVPIQELVGQGFFAWTGKKWAPATAIRKNRAQLLEVTYRGLSVEVDATHKFLMDTTSGYEWAAVEAVGTNRVAMDMARPLEFGEPTMDPRDAFVLGTYIADGWITAERAVFAVGNTHRTGPKIRGGVDCLQLLREFAERHKGKLNAQPLKLDEVRGGSRKVRASEETATHYRAQVSKRATTWLTARVDPTWTAHSKQIPEVIWRSTLDIRREFLKGFLCGDGYVTPDGAVFMNLCNRVLVQELVLLARTLGVDGHVLGPYPADALGHVYWRGVLNGAQSRTRLGFGRANRIKFNKDHQAPLYEIKRTWSRLAPTCTSDQVIKSRSRYFTRTTSPYVLQRMGVDDVYDHTRIEVRKTGREDWVYTLCVDDPEHRYVAEGLVSKNSGAGILMSQGLQRLRKVFPPDFERGLGIVNQMHDAVTLEVPESKAKEAAELTTELLSCEYPDRLPGMKFTTEAGAFMDWAEETKFEY